MLPLPEFNEDDDDGSVEHDVSPGYYID